MAARGTRGLSDEQIDQLRAEVAAGKSPRVQVTSAQLGGLTAGTVRAVGDPEGDGADYVTVRVKINGVTDDLRFAPRELSRGRTPRSPAAAKTVAAPAAPAPVVRADVEVVPPPPVREPAPRRRSRRPVEPAPAAAPTPPPAAPAASNKPRRAARRTPSAPPVTITFTSVDASWTVGAQRGARPIVKAAPVNPGVVSALTAMLDLPALDEAVAAVNDTARAEAETRAEQLRAELAELEAVLKGHERP